MTILGSRSSIFNSSLSGKRGFALLITLTLLAFIVVLLVGLATYARVETAVAGNTQRQAQARENALLALNIALGQLQKHAGADTRVTATGDFTDNPAAANLVGVWDTSTPGSPPITWLISGSEIDGVEPQSVIDQALDPTTPTAAGQVFLVGNNSVSANPNNPAPAELARRIKASLQPIDVDGVPGRSGSVSIGRYAWWVGDNGTKADVARGDVTDRLDYAPFVDAAGAPLQEARTRLLQHTGLGAAAFLTDSNSEIFDPRDPVNRALAPNVITPQQLPFLRNNNGAPLGLAPTRPKFHSWTARNFAVLGNTKPAADGPSLRRDLSLDPQALGAAFAAWADFPTYLEPPEQNPLLQPLAQPADGLRRRHRMVPSVTDANGSHFGVAPVLSYVSLAFSLRNNSRSSATHLECAVRCVVGLWNPYTSALVPEADGLQLFVTGLPTVEVYDTAGSVIPVDLQAKLGDPATDGSPLKFLLPWTVSGADDQRDSWLPGRVYNWSLPSSTSDPADGLGNPLNFGERDLSSGTGMLREAGPPLTQSTTSAPVGRWCTAGPTTLRFELRRASDGVVLASFDSPTFEAFSALAGAPINDTDNRVLDFAFVFRLADPTVDGAAWLETAGTDPRAPAPGVSPYVIPGNFAQPDLAVIFPSSGTAGNDLPGGATNPSLLLDRYPGTASAVAGASFEEDVPVFELPRAPLLSVGQLQHLALPAQRPFWIGSSASSVGPAPWTNALFDENFFSSLGSGSQWSDISRPLPNTLLHLLRQKPDGSRITVADLSVGSLSAKYLLQGGAFNLNSTDPDAWAAVLRSVRFPTGREFKYLDALDATGTNVDSAQASLTGSAAFLRYSQSAQETYKIGTIPGTYAQSEPGPSSGIVLPTHLYRRGLRTLDPATVTALATRIATAVKTRQAASGPFLSVEEFLNPAAGPGTLSLLEQAIADLGLNADPDDPAGGNYPFSAYYLTQSDIMTALAPVLFARSDTFVVRAYGEALNPATGQTEGKAWCEAIIQRFPEPFSPAVPSSPTDAEYQTPPGNFGRRFKIVSFRWLTRSDI